MEMKESFCLVGWRQCTVLAALAQGGMSSSEHCQNNSEYGLK